MKRAECGRTRRKRASRVVLRPGARRVGGPARRGCATGRMTARGMPSSKRPVPDEPSVRTETSQANRGR